MRSLPSNVRQRLQQLGVVKGARGLASSPTVPGVDIEDLVHGHFHTTPRGRCFVAEKQYPIGYVHGRGRLEDFLRLDQETIATITRDESLLTPTLRHSCFIDTETTGLSRGVGTIPFVVGVGFFTHEAFIVRQYFLRDPGDEAAMVQMLADDLRQFEVVVSFNGRTFDVPIIENRFILARLPSRLSQIPHLDLLYPARRLWRHGLPSCSLSALEQGPLAVVRGQADVPGAVIPSLYREYLWTRDAREMKRVLYHNQFDILSLVTLATRLVEVYSDPWSGPSLCGAEFFGLAHWYAADGRLDDAARAYSAALRRKLQPELRAKGLAELALLFKRSNRRAEAFRYWQQFALEASDNTRGHVELAKYFEWHVLNLALAAGWTGAALRRAQGWPPGLLRDLEIEALQHRLQRLERKIGQVASKDPS